MWLVSLTLVVTSCCSQSVNSSATETHSKLNLKVRVNPPSTGDTLLDQLDDLVYGQGVSLYLRSDVAEDMEKRAPLELRGEMRISEAIKVITSQLNVTLTETDYGIFLHRAD